MSKQTKKPLKQAQEIAAHIVKTLSPFCHQIEIAGSIRRQRPQIGDIEIVALPVVHVLESDLFGNPTKTTTNLHEFLTSCPLTLIKGAEPLAKFKQFKYGAYMVDLFLPASVDHWGSVFTIRTGSHDFNMWLMNTWQHRAGIKFRDGRVYKGAQLLQTKTEQQLFKAIGLPFIPPNKRDDQQWLNFI